MGHIERVGLEITTGREPYVGAATVHPEVEETSSETEEIVRRSEDAHIYTASQLRLFNSYKTDKSLDKYKTICLGEKALIGETQINLPDGPWLEILSYLDDPLVMREVCSYFTKEVFNLIYDQFYGMQLNIVIDSADAYQDFVASLSEMKPSSFIVAKQFLLENEGRLTPKQMNFIKLKAPFLVSSFSLEIEDQQALLFLLERYEDLSFLHYVKISSNIIDSDVFCAFIGCARNIKVLNLLRSQACADHLMTLIDAALPSLEKLLLNKRRIRKDQLEKIYKVAPNLVDLNCYMCQFEEGVLDFLGTTTLPKMRRMILKPTNLKSEHVRLCIEAMPNLTSLYLTAFEGDLSVFGQFDEGHLHQLSLIFLRDIKVTPQMLLDIIKLAPKLRHFGTANIDAFTESLEGLDELKKVNIQKVIVVCEDVDFRQIRRMCLALPDLKSLNVYSKLPPSQDYEDSLLKFCTEKGLILETN